MLMPSLLRGLRRLAAVTGRRTYPVDGICVVPPRPLGLSAYAALGYWRPGNAELEPRLELLVTQLVAELAGCRWCVEQGWHYWRRAYLPAEPMRALRDYRVSPGYSPRDRAALALAEAVSRYRDREPAPGGAALDQARVVFTEAEIARVVQIAAREHFFNPANGAIGLDAVDPCRTPADVARADSAMTSGES